MNNNVIKNQKGAIAIITLMVIGVFALAVMTTMSVLATSELKMSSSEQASEKTFYAAEAGINEAFYRLITNPVSDNFSIDIDGINVQVSFINNGFERIIQSHATDPSGKVRILEIFATTNTFASDLDFAVLSGPYLEMENNTEVYGEVYSNGNIYGSTGGVPKGKIYGNVKAAGTLAEKIVVLPYDLYYSNGDFFKHLDGNLHAHEIQKSDISGNAYSQIIDQYTLDNLDGVWDNTKPDPLPKPFPITDSHIADWTTEITDNVNDAISSGTGQLLTSNQTIASNTTWGTTKVEGDLTISNGFQLIITDYLWLTGILKLEENSSLVLYKNILVNSDIMVDQNTDIHLDASVGENDGLVIANGTITVLNGSNIYSLGDSKSSLMMLTTNNSLDSDYPAILAANQSTGVIYYAKDGKVVVDQTGDLKGTLAHTIHLKNNAIVRYEPDLQTFTIPPSEEEPIFTINDSWKEL